jgi:streptomycin 6-kinase
VLGGDPDATWDWGFLERVSTGLYVASLGGDGGPHLALGRRDCSA